MSRSSVETNSSPNEPEAYGIMFWVGVTRTRASTERIRYSLFNQFKKNMFFLKPLQKIDKKLHKVFKDM